jgi:hypothetical protein
MYKSRGILASASLFAAVSLIALSALPVWAATPCGPNTTSVSIRDNFNPGSLKAWKMPFPEDWKILQQGNLNYLHMERTREPGVPRRPLQFALLNDVKVGNFTLDVKVRSAQHSMIVVFDYVDTLHFYYVHLSDNPGTQISVHNGIFMVDGAPRRRIAGLEASPALPDHAWHDVRIVRNVRTGSIKVFLDKQTEPRFSVIDHTFACGQVGLGSFDETGDFAQFRLSSNDAHQLVASRK